MIKWVEIVLGAVSFAADLVTIQGALEAPPGLAITGAVLAASVLVAWLSRRDGGGGASRIAAVVRSALLDLRWRFRVEVPSLLMVSSDTQVSWRR